MSPVEQHGAHLDVAQPSLPAGPGGTGDDPGVAGPAGGNGPVEDASRRHVLPRGGDHKDPGTPAHQAGLGPLEDGYIVAGPVQERRRRASGDRSPDNADSHARRPRPPWSATREVTAIRQRSGHMFPEEADGTRSEGQQATPQPLSLDLPRSFTTASENRANGAGRGTSRSDAEQGAGVLVEDGAGGVWLDLGVVDEVDRADERVSVFATPAMRSSSSARPISPRASSACGSGSAAKALKRPRRRWTSSAYWSLTNLATAAAFGPSSLYGSCGPADRTCSSTPARS